MSSRWLKRRTRLRELLTTSVQDEDEEALAIDRVLHGQNIIGKTGIYYQHHSLPSLCLSDVFVKRKPLRSIS